MSQLHDQTTHPMTLGEFQSPVAPAVRFAPLISQSEYERQSQQYTGQALADLVEEIKRKPTLYTNVLDKRQGKGKALPLCTCCLR